MSQWMVEKSFTLLNATRVTGFQRDQETSYTVMMMDLQSTHSVKEVQETKNIFIVNLWSKSK